MQVIIQISELTRQASEYFDFNQIPYCATDIFDADVDIGGRYSLHNFRHTQHQTLLILPTQVFFSLCEWSVSRADMIEFLRQGNKIWVFSDIDTLVDSIRNSDHLLDIDQAIPPGSVKVILDGQLSDRHALSSLQNMRMVMIPYSWFFVVSRLHGSQTEKTNCQRDYLLTMNYKKECLHRKYLWNGLRAVDGLLDKGHVRYAPKGVNRIGMMPTQHNWVAGFVSMDLYRDSWLEIAPETLFKDGFFVTEKTIKPIVTKTPFLSVSSCKYLEYLKQFGFQTFGSIIDERYDQQPRIQDRVKLLLEQLQDIIRNGSQEFYESCRPILDHNQTRLCEIAGRKLYDTDLFIKQHLQEDGVI